MRYLFIDNFRGFTKTLLPIRDVNFFVGENSTGKTSILGLIKLLDTPQFYFDQRFNTNELRFGNFKDMVSIGASNQSYFRVGLVEMAPDGKKTNEYPSEAFLCTFV